MLRRLGTVKSVASVSVCIGLFVAGTTPAQAHHSFAMFDGTKCAVITGTVVKYTQSYPHTWLWLEVINTDGSNDTWGFEGADPSSMKLRGWSTALLKKGQKVDVTFNPIKDGRTGGSLKQVRLGSGQVLAGPHAGFPGEPMYCNFTNSQPIAKKTGE